ncbi:MAG TPA: hypothetical protein VNL37_06800, partial [Candidatus Polarisedimenticolia bacterium]|nr:hypothetical protein [Candidatus Polarisedimenticolia bacterium]
MRNTQSTVTRPQFSKRMAWRLGVLAACSLLVLSAASVTARADVASACSCSSHLECQVSGRGDYCSYAAPGGSGRACTVTMKPDVTLAAVSPYDQQFPNGVLVCSGPAGSPSCDGVCRSSRVPTTSYRSLRPAKLAQVADLLLQAYIKSGSGQGGAPDPALVDQARQAAMNFSLGWQNEILASVHNVLMTVLGGDFIPPQEGAFFGQIPKLTPESLALVQGVSQAFVEGLRNGDPTPVRNAVYDFFNNNTFSPLHAAHCYPDGVSQVENIPDCIAGELSGMTNVLIQGQDEACTEGGPDCQDEPPACDPNTQDCSGGEPPACDPNSQDCSGGEPPACDPNKQDCSG